jgi:5'-methylthioadenosine phosphorylase
LLDKAKIGIIGGSGFYSLLDKPVEIDKANAYGKPSAPVAIGKMHGKSVAFIPRHGLKHTLQPHRVPYRANIEAMAELGVHWLISTNAVGSLKKDYMPGDFVFFDQFVNMTHGRADTFYDADKVVHISTADPYCGELNAIAAKSAEKLGFKYHRNGTVVVINGPRFSSKAESRFFARQGFEVINMTQYPEVVLAREKSMCYLGIGIVTDYDAGLEGREDIKSVSADDLVKAFGSSIAKTKQLIDEIVQRIPESRDCKCSRSLDDAVISSV